MKHDGRAIKVLLVEDSPDHVMLMTRALLADGVVVHSVGTAEDALPLVDDVDLVLLDHKLPRMSGLELLRVLNERPGGPSVVLVTGNGSASVVVEAMRAGAIDYLTKEPGYLDRLPGAVRRAWRQHDLRQRSRELQRLAILVHDARGRGETMSEIVAGAARLLDAAHVGLFVQDGGHLELRASVGDVARIRTALSTGRSSLGVPVDRVRGNELLAVLSGDRDGPVGYLVVVGSTEVPFGDEDRELARTFAAFAASALRNLRQRELESELIASLQSTLDSRHDFIASISHELRTPLTSVTGYAETILGRAGQLSPEQILLFVEKIRSHAADLGGLIEQLLDLATVEHGKKLSVWLEPLDLAEEIRVCVDDLSVLTFGRVVSVEADPVLVMADGDMLRRILFNLISNAVKYSPEGSSIEVSAGVEQGMARVEVADHGAGMSDRDVSLVFNAFWRSPSATAGAVRGSGIGLSLVREYVRTLGGEIDVRSELGKGSVFRFTLPLADDVQMVEVGDTAAAS